MKRNFHNMMRWRMAPTREGMKIKRDDSFFLFVCQFVSPWTHRKWTINSLLLFSYRLHFITFKLYTTEDWNEKAVNFILCCCDDYFIALNNFSYNLISWTEKINEEDELIKNWVKKLSVLNSLNWCWSSESRAIFKLDDN